MQALSGWRDQQPGVAGRLHRGVAGWASASALGRLVLLVLIAPFWLLGKLLGGPRRRRR